MTSSLGNTLTSSNLVHLKSKFRAEFRRIAIEPEDVNTFEKFYSLIQQVHRLKDIPFEICYCDANNDLLPINNTDNYALAINRVKTILRLHIHKEGEFSYSGYGSLKRKGKTMMGKSPLGLIGQPQDFRQIAAIIDVDVIPETFRRVKLLKHDSDKPLGFFIRDGMSIRFTNRGLDKVPGIFISRLVHGGLAEMTGLLSVGDEVLEVNGIDVCGKTLDQVTDMMVANSSNLIITVKPSNQRAPTLPRDPGNRHSVHSMQSHLSDDEDEIIDMLHASNPKLDSNRGWSRDNIHQA